MRTSGERLAASCPHFRVFGIGRGILAGAPELSLPWLRDEGAPVGFSMAAAPGEDRALLALGERLDQRWGASMKMRT